MRALRREAELLGPLGRHHQHGGGTVGDLRRRAGGVHAVLAGDGLQGGQLLEGGLAQALVPADRLGAGELALLVDVGRLDRDDLAAEAVLGPRRGGVLLRAEAEAVGVLAGDAPLVGDALGALELRGHLVLREVRLRDRDAEAEVLAAARADRHPAHHLDAAGEGGVDGAAAHEGGGQVGGLLRGAALGVDGGVGHREREPGAEPRGATDVEGLLADLAHAAGDDLADGGRIDARPLDGRLLHGGEQVGGVDGGQPAVALPDGGADGFDDHDIRHAGNLPATQRRRPLAASRTRSRAAAPMKATNTEPRSSSSKVSSVLAGGELGRGAGEERAEDADGDRGQAAALRCPDRPAGQPAGEEPHDAPREDVHEGGDASGGSAGSGRRAEACSGGGAAVGRVLPGGLGGLGGAPGRDGGLEGRPEPRRRLAGPPHGWLRRSATPAGCRGG